MLRASGAMEMLQNGLRGPLEAIGLAPEILPMAIARSLTGAGSLAVLSDMTRQYGTDSIFVKMAATIYGSSETTFLPRSTPRPASIQASVPPSTFTTLGNPAVMNFSHA